MLQIIGAAKPGQGDAEGDIRKCRSILDLQIIGSNTDKWPIVLQEAAARTLLVYLSDLLQQASKDENRINFTDDIPQPPGSKRDVTDLMNSCRNAACHINSGEHLDHGLKFTFNIQIGAGVSMPLGDIQLSNQYNDDTVIAFGQHRLLLKRHAERALVEVARHFGVS